MSNTQNQTHEERLHPQPERKPFGRRLRPAEMDALPGREQTEKRTRAGKIYDLGGGLHQAVLFSDPVHFQNARGEWEEIDNTLIPVPGEPGALQTRAGDTTVTLRPAAQQLVTLSKGGCTLSYRLENALPVLPAAVPCAHEELDQRRAVLQRELSDALYENILPGADLRCHLEGGRFKEDVIFASAQAARPLTFALFAEGLTLSLAADASIEAKDADGELVFTLPAPFLLDSAAPQARGEVNVTLTETSANRYRLIYTPDDEFLNTARYPVTLDPVVVYSDKSLTSVVTAYVNSSQPSTSQNQTGTNLPIKGTSKMVFVRYPGENLPVIDASYYVTKAFASFYCYGAPTNTLTLQVHEVTGAASWTPATLTYANMPAVDPAPVDYAYLKSSYAGKTKFTYDISNLVRKWYAGNNKGFRLSCPSGAMAIYSMNSASYKPFVTINYVSLAGLEDYLSYETQGAGRAGVGHVSLYNGNLIFSHADTQMNGNLMPVSVSHCYNSCYHGVTAYRAGRGWKLSTQQTLHLEKIKDAAGTLIDYYVYTDGDGTRHHFKLTSGVWKDLSGLSLTLTISGATATITDKGDNTLLFELPTLEFQNDYSRVKFLQRAANAMGVSATFPSLGGGSAVDGAGRATSLAESGGLLYNITAPYMWQNGAKRGVYYTYSGDLLTGIEHEDGKTTTYQYDGNGLLLAARSHDGLTVRYAYTAQEPFRVTSAELCVTNAAMGVTKYISGRQYEYKDCLTVVTDRIADAAGSALIPGKKLFYHFNDYGNVVSVNDELGYAAFAKYADTDIVNHPEALSKLQRSVPNLMKNHNFLDASSTDWYADKMDGAGTCGYSSENNHIGGRAYKLDKTSATGRISVFQPVSSLKAGESYTFSVHYQTTGAAAVQLNVAVWQAGHSDCWFEGLPLTSTSKWDRTYLTFTVPAAMNNATANLRIMASGGVGAVYADGAQLETGTVMNRYNLLHNGTFAMNASGAPTNWSAGSGVSTGDGVYPDTIFSHKPASLSGNVLRIAGAMRTEKTYTQMFSCMGKKNDVFVLGGWAASKTRPRASGAEYHLELFARPKAEDVGVTSGTPSFRTVGVAEWSEEWSDWQFASNVIVMPWRYTALGVRIWYKDTLNTAEFTGLFLHQERFGRSFQYDGKGNVLSVENLAALKSGATYDAFNNLLTYKQPGRDEQYAMTYGTTDAQRKQHLLYTSTSPLDIRESYGYDNKGNVLSVDKRKAGDATYLRSESTCTANQNYAATQKDARAKVVQLATDLNAGTLTTVTDPNNQSVSYGYDALRRVTSVQSTASGNTYKNEYAYDAADRLRRVQHNTTDNSICDVQYTFSYDEAGRPTTVQVGAQTLSSNTYNPDGTLNTCTYGNGAVTQTVYDGFKRVTGVLCNGARQFTTEYAANGRPARLIDHTLNHVSVSEYDLANRPMRVITTNGAGHLYTGEVEYDGQNNLKTFKEKVGVTRTAYQTDFAYDVENKPTLLTFGDANNKVAYGYDALGRMASRTITANGSVYSSNYGYVAGGYGAGSTTGLISYISQGNDESCAYSYDNVGNIVSSTRGSLTTTYAYDGLGQLTRVNDPAENATWVYNYDRGGNILSKVKYAYTTGALGAAIQSISYTYGDANWKDKLTAYNGVGISYDAIGNPLSDGTWTYAWQKGRQLASMSKSGTSASFIYNADGLRIQKTVNGAVTNYILHGKNIVHLSRGSDDMHFWYDAQNRPAIIEFNSTKYAYIHNLQGDVVGLRDAAGTEVVRYTYDAWGKMLSTAGSLASTLGYMNPFRYRGYVYDEETGLYYLRSRYYNPTWGRFVNADVVYVDSLLGLNHFSYCINNPIIAVDREGTFRDTTELWGGWKYRIDAGKTATLEKKHIHIYNGSEKYSQNEDGSPSDGSKGDPPASIKKELKKKRVWDWDENKEKYINNLSESLAQGADLMFTPTNFNCFGYATEYEVVVNWHDTVSYDDYKVAAEKAGIVPYNPVKYSPHLFLMLPILDAVPALPSFSTIPALAW